MKRIIIIEVFVVLVILVSIVLVLFFRNSSQSPMGLMPAATPVQSPAPGSLIVLQSFPSDGSVDITNKQEIVIQFNREPKEGEYTFFISPKTPYTVSVSTNELRIKPQTAWEKGMPYRYGIYYENTGQLSQGFEFVTEGERTGELPDTQPDPTYIIGQNEYDRTYHPDTFVANQTPYENDDFSIESGYEKQPVAKTYFTVRSKSGIVDEKVRTSVNTWLLSLKLTPEQIASLDIRYQ